jgi:hypothetical protein
MPSSPHYSAQCSARLSVPGAPPIDFPNQSDWMPCAKALPPMADYYLVTWMGGTKIDALPDGTWRSRLRTVVGEMWFSPATKWFFPDYARKRDGHPMAVDSELVIAWRSLPEPYRPEPK